MNIKERVLHKRKKKVEFGTDNTNNKPQTTNSNKDNETSDDKKSKEKEIKNSASFTTLFRYATKLDLFLIFIGTLGALANGATTPLLLIVFGNMINGFTIDSRVCNESYISSLNSTNFTTDNGIGSLTVKINDQLKWLFILGAASLVLSYFQVTFWMIPGDRQTNKIRKSLFKSILKQEIGWFDVYKSGELTARLTDDVNKIREALGDKFGSCLQYLSSFVSGLSIGFAYEWKLTLVILSISPLLLLATVAFATIIKYFTVNELKSYAKAGAIAEEVFTAIRTVFAFNGAQKEHVRYVKELNDAQKVGIKKGMLNGLVMGFMWLCVNGAYALGLWYGWKLSAEIDPVTLQHRFSIGSILVVFFSIIIAIFTLGQAAPFLTTLSEARSAAYEVFRIIDRESLINIENERGEKPNEIIGNINFKDVTFHYPSRPDVTVLDSFNLDITPKSTVALVGTSGCGKSTTIQLLQRFYDPIKGSVFLDGRNLKDLNLAWLRRHIGVVNQEPVLFATTIAENIRMGKDDVTQQDIEVAAKNANAHNFIMELPDKYETHVGNLGSQMSGGQKQRIAIARALIRNPKLLLLDEATSALDNKSELIVQEALDKARIGRTTIIVAHRLSTIRNADIIYAFDKGKVAEWGTHDELMAKEGIYYQLVKAQESAAAEDDDEGQEKKEIKKFDPLKRRRSTIVEETKDEEDEEATEEKKIKKLKEPSFLKIFELNKPELCYVILGCLGSLITGGVQPAFSVVYASFISVFEKCDINEQKKDVDLYCILFAVFGVLLLIGHFLQSGMFGVSGERLTKRLRAQAFKSMLSQEIGWFDDPDNNIGTLCTKLAVEAAAIKGATGQRLGYILMCLANMGVGIIIAFVFGWAITLLVLGFIPFIILSGVIRTRMMSGYAVKDKKILEQSGKITNESIGNIRTVAILTKENYFYTQYAAKIDIPHKEGMKTSHIHGVAFGFTNAIMFFAIAAAFALGAYLVQNNMFGMTFKKLMIVFNCLIFGAQALGQASALLPDYTKAKISATKMFDLFDRKPKINNWAPESNNTIDPKNFQSSIEFKNLEFTYPLRPDVKVLKGLTITVLQGQRIALVGSSGCGKSTTTQLLERFYDPDGGEIKLSGVETKSLNLHWLRSQIGLVSQEPILFDTSIAENIAYGDNSKEVSMDEIIEAAKQANIHDTITKLPDGYKTNVGSKGTQLSGGQKQRIAIARALIRNPKILLLDEATSALDTESEKIVEEALERAQQGRTCIVIAHRLSTIQNADVIYCINEGNVVEYGTHDSLMSKQGYYYKLQKRMH